MNPGAGEEISVSFQEMDRQYDLCLERGVIEKMARLDEMLVRWSRAIALSGFNSADERADRYFAEALLAGEWLPEKGVAVDVGSGGGSPALPMAIAHPTLLWVLLEPNLRKAVFLEEVVQALNMSNVEVVRDRLEEYRPETGADVVTCRGVALGEDSIRVMSGWLSPEGWMLLFTGRRVSQEIARYGLLASGTSGLKIGSRHELPTKAKPTLLILTRCHKKGGSECFT